MAGQGVMKRLFVLVMVVLALPLLNFFFGFVQSGPLEGVSAPGRVVKLTPATWWDGSFQEYGNNYMNDSIGFRPDLVRMTNQIDYWLFDRINAEKVILGKNGHLFASMYINEYNAVYNVPDTATRRLCMQLQRIQDTMDKLGKTFIIAITPSKPYVYPSQLPSKWERRANTRAAFYTQFRQYGDAMHLRFLDFNQWFAAMAPTERYPLMPKTGVHWSCYASILAADSMVHFVERERHINMPHIRITSVKVTDTPRAPDNDISNIINLVYPFARETLAYPETDYDTTGNTRPRAIYIGDSFMWLWLKYNIPGNVNSNWEFWEHFTNVWRLKTIMGEETALKIKDYDWKKQVDNADYIMLIYNPVNYKSYYDPENFVQSVYNYYFHIK